MFPLERFAEDLRKTKPTRVKGCADLPQRQQERRPANPPAQHEAQQSPHDVTVLLCVTFDEVPRVPEEERSEVENMANASTGSSSTSASWSPPT
jgi:K+ transporter